MNRTEAVRLAQQTALATVVVLVTLAALGLLVLLVTLTFNV